MYCLNCTHWKHSTYIEEKHGDGMGECTVSNQCAHKLKHGCLLYKKRETQSISENSNSGIIKE